MSLALVALVMRLQSLRCGFMVIGALVFLDGQSYYFVSNPATNL